MKRSLALLYAGCALLCSARSAASQIHVLVPEDPNRERRLYTSRIMREFAGVMSEWRGAWNVDDAKTVSHLYTEDATLLLATADTAVRGRGEIEKALSASLPCAGEILTGVEDFRVNGELAYAMGRYHLATPEGAEGLAGTYMMVLENRGRRWLIRSQLFRPDGGGSVSAPACGAPAAGEGAQP